MESKKKRNRISYIGIVRTVIKTSGLAHACVAFAVTFVICTILIKLFDPNFPSYLDSAWYCFTIVTTIGFGDIVAQTFLGRIVTVVLSMISIFFVAILTGTVVNYTSEVLQAYKNKSAAQLIDKVEHLPELSKEELVELATMLKEG